MKRNYSVFVAAALSLVLLAGPVIAEDKAESCPLTLSASTAFVTDYMWRGFNLYQGASIQPAVEGTYDLGEYGSVSASIWSQVPGKSGSSHDNFWEMDYTAYYTYTMDKLSFSFGHIYYTYPNRTESEIPSTGEFFGSIEVDTLLSPTFTMYHDYDEFDYQYYELGFSHAFEVDSLGKGFNLTPYATFGFASSAEGVYENDGLEQVTFGVSSETNLGDITLTPSLNYTAAVDDQADNSFWAGMTLGYGF